jgi:hypothetical protein
MSRGETSEAHWQFGLKHRRLSHEYQADRLYPALNWGLFRVNWPLIFEKCLLQAILQDSRFVTLNSD